MSDEQDRPPDEALTTRDFARHHGVHVKTVWRWIEEGRVQAYKCPGGYRWRVVVGKFNARTIPKPPKP